MTELSNSLADLAERIKETHGEFTAAQSMTAEKAIETGTLLCQAKAQCAHGEWLPFLARSGVGDRWARRLMQIARSELKSDTVSDLGIKGTLDYLASRRLPEAGQCLIVGRSGWEGSSDHGPVAFITPSERTSGYFDVTTYDPNTNDGEALVRPVLGEPIEFDDGTAFVGVWKALDEMLAIPASERSFKLMWASDLEDDCAFLNDAEWAKWSDGEIARQCHVSQPFVSKFRPTVTQNVMSEERTYTTKHGTVSTMNTAAIGTPS